MSIYAVIGSGFTEVPRREMNGSAHKAFPLITCASRFEERQDAVNDLIKRLEDIVMNAEDDVVLYTYSQVGTPFGNIDSNMTFSKTVFDEEHPDAWKFIATTMWKWKWAVTRQPTQSSASRRTNHDY